MNWPWADSALLREQIQAANRRTMAAESAFLQLRQDVHEYLKERVVKLEAQLESERAENRKSERHFASMWLRHNKSLPLPKTTDEKEEAKAEAEEVKNQPPTLTDVQLAMRDANRRDAARVGISEEDADRDFQKYLNQMNTE